MIYLIWFDFFENKSNDINQKENFDGPSWKAKRLTDSFVIFLSDLYLIHLYYHTILLYLVFNN